MILKKKLNKNKTSKLAKPTQHGIISHQKGAQKTGPSKRQK
jgi:hypothetical protein